MYVIENQGDFLDRYANKFLKKTKVKKLKKQRTDFMDDFEIQLTKEKLFFLLYYNSCLVWSAWKALVH